MSITASDGKLRIKAPPGVVTPALRNRLAEHKADILAQLCAPQAPQPSASCPVPVENAPEPAQKQRADALDALVDAINLKHPAGKTMRASQLESLRRHEREIELSAAADKAGGELAYESLLYASGHYVAGVSALVGQLQPENGWEEFPV